jgi:AraC family carnitine catabolism transcriptional activator
LAGLTKPQRTSDLPHTTPCRFGLLLVPGFSHLGLALVTEPLFIANWISGKPLFSWQTLSLDGLAIAASNGLRLAVDRPLAAEDAFDTVLVLASFDARQSAQDTRLLAWLRRMARKGAEVGAVETGSEILAEAGLLAGAAVPVHWYNREGLRERHPDVTLTDGLYSLARNRPVSAGATTTLDLMLALIARQAGADLAREVGHHLFHTPRAPETRQRQFSDPLPPPTPGDPVARALDIMQAHLEDPLPCPAIAEAAGQSERHLQRLFHARLGRGMAASYLMLRMERAHQLVQQTDLSITEIGASCGFATPQSFSRTYRKVFKVAPSQDRHQSTQNTVFRRLSSASAEA